MDIIRTQADRYVYSGILEKWHNKEWKHFTNCPAAKTEVQNYLAKIQTAREDGVGLYLWGANGVGKSLCMNIAFKQLLAQGYKVHIITLSTIITKFTGSWYDSEQRNELYGRLLNVDFLGIEEIGKEFKSATDLGSVVLDSIIKYRIQRGLPTWATSNVKPTEISGTYTIDIASMLKEASVPVQFVGEDYRDKIKERIKKFTT
jgi:DNA replication protein DnaC